MGTCIHWRLERKPLPESPLPEAFKELLSPQCSRCFGAMWDGTTVHTVLYQSLLSHVCTCTYSIPRAPLQAPHHGAFEIALAQFLSRMAGCQGGWKGFLCCDPLFDGKVLWILALVAALRWNSLHEDITPTNFPVAKFTARELRLSTASMHTWKGAVIYKGGRNLRQSC